MYELIHKIKWVDGLMLAGIILIIIGIGMNLRRNNNQGRVEVVKAEITITGTPELKSGKKILVDINGQVTNPGMYSLDEGARVNDVLIAAGGLALKADRDWAASNLNRAQILTDGEKIYIPKAGENNQFQTANSQNKSGKISINKATAEELDKLNGIGPSMANRIIDYRVKNGGFKSLEEIKLVSGIGDKMWQKIMDQISL